MGLKCYMYHVYYMVSFAIFLTAGLLGLLLLAGVASQCVKVCPLVAPDGTPCNLKQGVCLKGGAAGCVDKEKMYQHADSDKLKADFANHCFVCIDSDVYWPNAKSTGTLKWVPAGGCESVQNYGGQDPGAEELCWSVDPEMGLRGLAVPLLFLTAILYLLQAIGTLVCSMGMKHFAKKYSQDWKKLSVNEVRLGLLVKVFPRINRILNVGVLVLLLVLLFMMFGLRVCYDVVNDFGERAFYPAASMYVALVMMFFIATCLGGTIFRRAVPYETPFYQPRMRPEEDKVFAYYCYEPVCYTFSILGP